MLWLNACEVDQAMAAEHAYRSDQSSGSSIQQAEAAGLAVHGKRMRAGVRCSPYARQHHGSRGAGGPTTRLVLRFDALASARANAAGM